MNNLPIAEYTVDVKHNSGDTVEVTVLVNLDAIAVAMAWRAAHNKNGKARYMHGAVTVMGRIIDSSEREV
jgi:hypothetical protein